MMNYKNKYINNEILIIGLGKTGKAIANFFKKLNVKIYFWDDKKINLRNANNRKVQPFKFKEKRITDFDEIFVSPGVNKQHFLIKEAIKKKLIIKNDIDLFWEFQKLKRHSKKIVGVTGTNGKSTISLMISKVLKTKPLGNFGNSILKALETKEKNIVVELSSFQLDYINNFSPNIAIISNIEKDHINHHKTFKKYLEAKKNIFRHQNKEDFLILNFDDKNNKNLLVSKRKIKSKIVLISNKSFLKKGITIANDKLIDNYFSKKEYTLRYSKFLNLKHNKVNLGISFAALRILGLDANHILKKLSYFRGLPHRLELLGNINNIDFFNDSKATNVAATCSALGAFDKVILIAGGSDKGDNFNPLKKYRDIIFETFLFGETAFKISDSLHGSKNNICSDLDDAVIKSFNLSITSGKFYPILFSPACASYDSYINFEKRGEHFKRIFKKIKKEAA